MRLLSTAACCFRRAVLEQFNFDEGLTGYALGEDWDFSLRAGRVFRFGAIPTACAYHRRSPMGRAEPVAMRHALRASITFLWLRHRRHPGDDLCYLWLRLGLALDAVRLPVRAGGRRAVRDSHTGDSG